MIVLHPVRFVRGWLAKPHYKPSFPADIACPRINWHTAPYQAGWDQIIDERNDLLCWAEVNGIYRYGVCSKDPQRRPGHGTYWSSRASECGRKVDGLRVAQARL